MGMEGAPGQRTKEMVWVKCPKCNGSGKQGEETCKICLGKGEVARS